MYMVEFLWLEVGWRGDSEASMLTNQFTHLRVTPEVIRRFESGGGQYTVNRFYDEGLHQIGGLGNHAKSLLISV